jgi:hypothetical protein
LSATDSAREIQHRTTRNARHGVHQRACRRVAKQRPRDVSQATRERPGDFAEQPWSKLLDQFRCGFRKQLSAELRCDRQQFGSGKLCSQWNERQEVLGSLLLVRCFSGGVTRVFHHRLELCALGRAGLELELRRCFVLEFAFDCRVASRPLPQRLPGCREGDPAQRLRTTRAISQPGEMIEEHFVFALLLVLLLELELVFQFAFEFKFQLLLQLSRYAGHNISFR